MAGATPPAGPIHVPGGGLRTGDHRCGSAMRFAFRTLPAASGGALTPRPVVDIALEGLQAAPIECLLDTGALRTRMSAEIASLAGIELSGDLTEEFFIAGVKTAGTMARVNLMVTDGTDEFSWD